MKEKEIQLYLDFAHRVAQLSYASCLKVGAVIAKDNGIILSYGYNGMPKGMTNVCEDTNGRTKPEVIHAEANAILKCAREGHSTEGATLFITHSPCIECAKLILQSGIKEVVYAKSYRDLYGTTLLNNNNIYTFQYGI